MSESTYRIAEDPAMPAVGSRIDDRYEIRRILGEGGFAAVFEAHDHRTGSSVAIKVLDPIMTRRKDLAERFKREVDTVARLKHHNTIKVSDSGTTPGGCLYLVMELLDGKALDDVLQREGRLEPGRVVRISAQILKSLNEAHAAGIIHRDLKPANIFLVNLVGEVDYVKVLDFGIAKSLDASGEKALTQTGELMCSPHYVAPERITGGNAFPASDLYSLGVMMIELLEGKPPYDAETPMAVAVMHMRIDDPVPMQPALEQSPLGQIIRKAVAKDITERFQSAAEMLQALSALEGLGPIPFLTGQNAAASGPAPHTPSDAFRPPSGLMAPHTGGAFAPATHPQGPPPLVASHAAETAAAAAHDNAPPPRRGGLVIAAILATAILVTGAVGAYLLHDRSGGYLTAESPADPPAQPQAEGPEGTPAVIAPSAQEDPSTDSADDDAAAAATDDDGTPDDPAPTPDAPLLVRSLPAGALVFIGEESIGQTPLTLAGDDLEFPMTLRIVHDGHLPLELTLADAAQAREALDAAFALALLPETPEAPSPQAHDVGGTGETGSAGEADPQPSGSDASAQEAPDTPATTAPSRPDPRPTTRPTPPSDSRPTARPAAPSSPRPTTRPTPTPSTPGYMDRDATPPTRERGQPTRYFGSN